MSRNLSLARELATYPVTRALELVVRRHFGRLWAFVVAFGGGGGLVVVLLGIMRNRTVARCWSRAVVFCNWCGWQAIAGVGST